MPRVVKAWPLLLALACAGPGQYVWIDDLPAAPAAEAYLIGPGDVISLRVYNQDAMSVKARVRPDGKVSMPFLNDVAAAGYTPEVLGQQIQSRLKDYLNVPVVTVSVDEPRPLT